MDFDIAGFFYDAFGYNSEAFNPKFSPVTPRNGDHGTFSPKFDQVTGNSINDLNRAEFGKIGGSPYYAVDVQTGLEYFLPLEVNVGNGTIPGTSTTYAQKLGGKTGMQSGLWNLPNPIVCANIDIQKNIIDTALTERNGMVSELINVKAFKVAVKGFLINEKNEFPESDFIALNTLFNFNIPIVVNNVVTDVLLMEYQGSKTVTMRNLRFLQRPGVKHVVPYELELVGDLPFNLNDIS